MYFLNTNYDMLHHLTEFEIKTQLVHRETKQINLVKG